MPPLTPESLSSLDPAVATPSYDRSRVTAGVVHFGVGGFHRAHQAMYLDRLMNDDPENANGALDYGICGVGVLPGDKRMQDALEAQGCLYTLVLKYPDGTYQPRVIGSIVEYLYAPDDPEAVIEKMAADTTRIVSLTVTEGGYNFNAVTGDFEEDNPDVQHDLQPGVAPKTFFGLITEALVRRRERGLAPFTVMSCDNIQGNGDAARKSFSAFARLRGAPESDLADWMEREVAFPNCMVDRITPVTTDDDRAEIAERFGVEDRWPVVGEDFTQWVLEDHFPAGRPRLEDAGVQLVEDVEPYELMKLRLLNAGHQGIAYLGYLAGYRLAHDVAQDPLFASFLLAYMDREATPTLSPVPGVDLDAYKPNLIERFSNEHVRDTVARLAAESSDRIPKWVLPVIRENLAHDGEITRAALIVAAWARYAEGVDERGEPIEIVDRLADRLHAAARRNREDPLAFLRDRQVFGDLVDDERFTAVYRRHLDSLHEHGVRATLEKLA